MAVTGKSGAMYTENRFNIQFNFNLITQQVTKESDSVQSEIQKQRIMFFTHSLVYNTTLAKSSPSSHFAQYADTRFAGLGRVQCPLREVHPTLLHGGMFPCSPSSRQGEALHWFV